MVTGSMIEVRDNGPGIASDVVADTLDFSVRVSSREALGGPTRGAQGNALKTLMMMVFVAGDGLPGRTEIIGQGIHHEIEVVVDRIANEPRCDYKTTPCDVGNCTIVRLHLAS